MCYRYVILAEDQLSQTSINRIAIMQKDALNNVHITDDQVLMTPEQLKAAFPLSLQQEAQIADSRKSISDIIAGRDPRLLVVCGPCSIHDPETALEYARRFKALAAEVSDSLYLVMRVYFEKPRTTVGWKGERNDEKVYRPLVGFTG
jgi:3-deoxy-7-phosphoheptulonate synthase